MEKRRFKRFTRRLTVRFGERALDKSGFTFDVSAGGAFVCAGTLPPIGTRIHLQLLISPERSCYYEAVVCRHRIVPSQLRSIERNGFGVRFLTATEMLSEVIPQSAAGNRFELSFGDVNRLRDAVDRELRYGGLFIRTERALPRDTAVVIGLDLPFAGRALEFTGRVVQVITTAGVQGLAMAFDKPEEVLAAVGEFLKPGP